LDAFVRNASSAPSGRLRLTVPMSFGTIQLAPFPDLVVDLVDEGFDVAVRIGTRHRASMLSIRLASTSTQVRALVDFLANFFRSKPEWDRGW
jgi:DNA-binding transcriptional LysR family regulator